VHGIGHALLLLHIEVAVDLREEGIRGQLAVA
jgi:hypothetical protein